MKRILFVSILSVLIVLGPGCQLFEISPADPAESTDGQTAAAIDLDSPTGGFNYEDEEPAFGEADRYEELMVDEPYDDELENDLEVQNAYRHRYVKMYRFRAVWGQLANTSRDSTVTDCCTLDWTGQLKVEGGIVVIERLIAFDPHDYAYRIDRSTIGWVSHTCPHVDGIQVRIIVSPGPRESTQADVEPAVIFRTGPYSRRFTLDELAALSIEEPVDRCGNGISIHSHIIPYGCPHGHLAGAWKAITADSSIVTPADTSDNDSTETQRGIRGVFRGIWFGGEGRMAGYVKGVYGINSEGKKVFFGKYIDRSGRFMGILKGQYGPMEEIAYCNDPAIRHGWFAGIWMGRNEILNGRLKGRWVQTERGFGFFHGVWGMNCSRYLE